VVLHFKTHDADNPAEPVTTRERQFIQRNRRRRRPMLCLTETRRSYIKDIKLKRGISEIITEDVMKSIEATLEIQNTPTDKTNELLTTVLTASTFY
jgi:hypothetical protein